MRVVGCARSVFYAWLRRRPRGRPVPRPTPRWPSGSGRSTASRRHQGGPRITAELNDGADGPRVNHKRVARVMRAHGIAGVRLRRKVRTTVPEPADQKVPDLLRPGLHRGRAEPALRRRHHLPADRRRREPVPGHRDRLLLPAAGRLGDRRAHAHRTGRRRAASGRRDRGSAWPARSSTAITAPSTPRRTSPTCAPSSGSPSRWARSAPAPTTPLAESFNATLKRETLQGAKSLAQPRSPPGGVPVGHPLQHPPPAFLLRLPQPDRLRAAKHR